MHRSKLGFGRKLLLVAIATTAVAGPIVVGIVNAPRLRAEPQSAVAFDTASVKSRKPDAKPGASRRMRVSPEGITYTDINAERLDSSGLWRQTLSGHRTGLDHGPRATTLLRRPLARFPKRSLS